MFRSNRYEIDHFGSYPLTTIDDTFVGTKFRFYDMANELAQAPIKDKNVGLKNGQNKIQSPSNMCKVNLIATQLTFSN